MRDPGRLNRYDMMLAAGLLLTALVLLLLPLLRLNQPPAAAVVELRQQGRLLGSYPLDEDREIPVSQGGHDNLVVIASGQVYMAQADCANQHCVKHRPISRLHQTIVCLPARLVVIIVQGEAAEYDAITN